MHFDAGGRKRAVYSGAAAAAATPEADQP